MQHRTHTHGTGLKRDKHFAIIEPVVTEGQGCRAQSQNLGVPSGVHGSDGRIAPHRNHPTVVDHNSTYGDLIVSQGELGLLKGQCHEGGVIHGLASESKRWSAARAVSALFPLNRGRRLAADIVGHTVDAAHFVDDAT